MASESRSRRGHAGTAAPAKAATASTDTARKTTPLIQDGVNAAKATAATKDALAAPLRAPLPNAPLIAIE